MNLNFDYYKKDIILPNSEELKIINNYKKNKQSSKISYQELYYSKKLKGNILSWYPFEKKSNILEINSGMEEFTKSLCNIANKVTKIEFSKTKAEYWYEKYKEVDNLEIILGNLNEIEFDNKFDYIILFGNLAYSKYLFNSREPEKDLIVLLKRKLNENGKIILIVDNKFSAQKISTNQIFKEEGLLGKNEIINILKNAQCEEYKFYYIFPNFRYANVIFSDEYLPDENNTKLDYLKLYDEKECILQEEKKVLIEGIKNRCFDMFANSYFIEISKQKNKEKKPIFVTYNIVRKEKYQIITKIYKEKVIKANTSTENLSHFNDIKNNLQILKLLKFNTIENINDSNEIESKFIEKKTFDNELIRLLQENKFEEFYCNIDNWYNNIKTKLTKSIDIENNIFEFFGINVLDDVKESFNFVKEGLFDLVFENTFKIEDDFYIFDQEWLIENIPIEFIIYRAIKNLCAYNNIVEQQITFEQICNHYGISDYIKIFSTLENAIQQYINDSEMLDIHLKSVNNKIEIGKINDFKVKIEEKNNLINKKNEEINRIVKDNLLLNKLNTEKDNLIIEKDKEIKRIVEDNAYLNKINKDLNKIINNQ
ncbi:MAG: rRNA adenine N-6-methyltransferase family protein [Candidatus Scatovivens sp.]